MAVNDRKMFRRRDARNQLRQMGGIMSSSPELMATIQKFNLGGRVDLSQPARNIAFPMARVERAEQMFDQGITNIKDILGVDGSPLGFDGAQPVLSEPQRIEEQYPSKGTRTISMEEQGMGEGLLRGYKQMQAPVVTAEEGGMGEGVLPDYGQLSGTPRQAPPPPTITETSALLEPMTVGKEMQTYAQRLMNSGADQTEINDKILEMIGEKEQGKQISVEERYEKNRALYEKVLGKDPEQDRKIDGYNLAMMGFMIAAGDSPNALTNIARGAAKGAERMQMTAEKRQERRRRIKELGLTQAIQDDRTALQYEREEERWRKGQLMGWLKSRVDSVEADKRLGIQLASQVAQLQTKISSDIAIANNKTINDDLRANAEREANRELLVIKGLQDPNVGSLATSQLLSEGIQLNDPQFSTMLTERVRTLVQDPEIVAALRVGSSTGSKGALDPGRQFQVITGKEGTMEPLIRIAEEQLAQELGRNPTEAEAYNRALILAQQQSVTGQISGAQPTQRVQLD